MSCLCEGVTNFWRNALTSSAVRQFLRCAGNFFAIGPILWAPYVTMAKGSLRFTERVPRLQLSMYFS